MQYLLFGVIWAGLVATGFLVAGAAAAANIDRLNRTEVSAKAAHQIHFENNTQLFIITVLLAGILAVLVTTLLVR